MWIVRLALRRPYTFVVMSLVIVILGVLAIVRMPTDIFPEIDIPVVSVIWSYGGLSPEEMAGPITTIANAPSPRPSTTSSTWSRSRCPGSASSRCSSIPTPRSSRRRAGRGRSRSRCLGLPPGITPPLIIALQRLERAHPAAEHSQRQLSSSSSTTTATTSSAPAGHRAGRQLPLPYGGKPRQVMVDLDPQALYAQGLSPSDVVNAVHQPEHDSAAGTAKIGVGEYTVRLNSSPEVAAAFNDIADQADNGATVYIRDVAHVRDGFAVQTNIVRHNGRRARLLPMLKNGGASTLDDRRAASKELLPRIRATLPPELNSSCCSISRVFVRAAIDGVLHEAIIAACYRR